ncbi:MAG: HAD family hydrolase [Alphaproteobacteria bacterium]|nr:HAD family hydrolase [Alphaproteobacteria bacterium]
MSEAPQLHWLPELPDFRVRLRALRDSKSWDEAVALAGARLDFVRTNGLDEIVRQAFDRPPESLATKPIRLALLGSSTLAHLHAALRVAALRRGMWLTIYENDYGQYLQELHDPGSALYRFEPTAVLFAFDAHHLTAGLHAGMDAGEAEAALDETLSRIALCWRLAREAFRCPIVQQTVLDVLPGLMGSNEHRLPGSRRRMVARLNEALREKAEEAGVDLLALDDRAVQDGLRAWHDAGLWHHAKQEVAPPAAPMYGELVGRLLAARQGRSSKCLVLDLDNTIWGGVIGDDGLDGIVLGQGSALGEGFVAVQEYARDLSRRGVILAVSSKNDEANALEPFDKHPEMVLRRQDIATFRADWNDKAANIRAIAADLNIGLDSLVFLDDNPFERALVRQELPGVAVPEVPDDPALVPQALADAGYFEAVAVTDDDRVRTSQYQSNKARESLKASATDLDGYLRGLDMRLVWRRFDRPGLQRTVQLINKTNQFNLTTRRYTEDEVLAVMEDRNAFGLQLRLIDRFGDNGVIAIVIGRKNGTDVLIDTWLMSCRVLGRQVEATTLNLVAAAARRLGGKRLLGEYLPTRKNAMVRDHYAKLGFEVIEARQDGGSMAALDLDDFAPARSFIEVAEGSEGLEPAGSMAMAEG